MPKGYYLKRSERTTVPQRLVAFAAGWRTGAEPCEVTDHPRRLVWIDAIYQSRRGLHWHEPIRQRIKTARAWWDWLERLARPGSPLWLVSLDLFNDLCLAGMFGEHARGNLLLQSHPESQGDVSTLAQQSQRGFRGRIVARNPPDIVHLRNSRGYLRGVSLRNYTQADALELIESAGLTVRHRRRHEPRTALGEYPTDLLAETCLVTWRGLVQWWTENECGPWRETAAQLSLSAYKTRFCTVKLLMHHDQDAQDIERMACHGARASVWYLGDCGRVPSVRQVTQAPPPRFHCKPIPGPVFRLDVRSQYPYLLAQHQFPIRLVGRWVDPDLTKVRATLRYYGVIAWVRLKTDQAEYPVHRDNRTLYPTGEFSTVLAGPELARALDEGAVRSVGHCLHYEMSPAYSDYANWCWSQRDRCRRAGDRVGELWAKTLANSFSGKLAQRGGRWVPYPECPSQRDWGFEWVWDIPSQSAHAVRFIAGTPERWDRTARKSSVSPATFAYLTAYGRCMMRDLRALAGPRQVIAQDTDCLWVTPLGFDRLKSHGKIAPGSFGGLKIENIIKYIRFLSPRHYYQDGTWVLSGVAEGFEALGQSRFRERRVINHQRHIVDGPTPRIKTITRDLDFSLLAGRYAQTEDGWTIPPHLDG